MKIADPISKDFPVKAQRDALNPGVLDSKGIRMPPSYNMQVDDNMTADVKQYIKKTASLSIIGLEDLSGATQSYQDYPLSFKKWDPLYAELQLLVGHDVNSRRMVVIISKNRRLKVLCYLKEEGWTILGHFKTIRQICTALGILNSAAEYFPWAKAQLFVLENLLRIVIQNRFIQAKASKKFREEISISKTRLPTSMYYRMNSIAAGMEAQFVYANDLEMKIGEQITTAVLIIYDYLFNNEPWECPIGHIVPRVGPTNLDFVW